MSKRERYLRALGNEPVDELVWAPNFDYWLAVNTAEGTLPERYAGMSRNDIVRSIGGYIWNRAVGLRVVVDPSVKEQWRSENGASIHEIETPVGSVRAVYQVAEGPKRTRALTEHFIKGLDDLEVMKYVVQATSYEPDYEPTLRALRETGDDGIVLNSYFCVPFIQFAKTDAGYINGYYLWADHREQVDSLIDLYFENFLEGYKVLADGPADVIATGDNMDGVMISPAVFKEYAVPFYHEVERICAGKSKLFEGHWCGRTESLLHLVPGCGLDIVEAIVTEPMSEISVAGALDLLRGRVVLQGGIPSVLVCREGCTAEEFERHITDVILPLKGRKGFILGMADNVPPNADFARVEAVSRIVAYQPALSRHSEQREESPHRGRDSSLRSE